MEPDLSIVIPTLNEAKNIRSALQRAVEGAGPLSVELIVVDGGSTDATVRIAGESAEVLHGPTGRARQLNMGLERSNASAVLFCHGDTELPHGYAETVLESLKNPAVVGGAFRPRYFPPRPILHLLELLLRVGSPYLMFGDQAIYARRSALDTIGGVPELPLMEDVALVMALRRHGRLVRLPLAVHTSSRRLLEGSVLRQLLLDARLLFSYHLLHADPGELADLYHSTDRDHPLRAEFSGQVLAVLAKAPIPGHAKTRLGQAIGMEAAASVYERVLRRQLSTLAMGLPRTEKRLYVASQRDRPWFEEYGRTWQLSEQASGDLGDRIARAFQQCFEGGAKQVVVVGADSPDLTTGLIQEAFSTLAENDLVLGPTTDGGYYLIGQRAPGAPLFERIPWSTPQVLARTRRRAERLGLTCRLLPPLIDIDTVEDWRAYQDRAPGS